MSLLTVKQAAERAMVSESLIYQWCDERRLVHYRVGGAGKRGKILIDPADLDIFMASLKVQARSTPKRSTPHKTYRHFRS
jgi:excisionase family DNA binding protein